MKSRHCVFQVALDEFTMGYKIRQGKEKITTIALFYIVACKSWDILQIRITCLYEQKLTELWTASNLKTQYVKGEI